MILPRRFTVQTASEQSTKRTGKAGHALLATTGAVAALARGNESMK